MEWIGVNSSDILGPWYSTGDNAMMPMHGDDRRKATTMLRKGVFREDGLELTWRRELQVMLMLNGKIEIQAMDDGQPVCFCTWLEQKMMMD
jgi:meiotic recombination protein SPO11